MRPYWHPLSTILLTDPPCFASGSLLRMLLDAEASVTLRYAGDRMWPAVRDGDSFRAVRVDPDRLRPGTAVLASVSGVPDLLRVASVDEGRVRLVGDSDPQGIVELTTGDLLARAELPERPAGRVSAAARRLLLDAREAWAGRVDAGEDPAQTVLEKYDTQAVHYARACRADLEVDLERRIRERTPAGAPVLVVGSGAGRECFALAEGGFEVTGVDFSPSMVRAAEQEAERRELRVRFEAADIRHYRVPAASVGAVVFTYNVYSFLPHAPDRIAVLERMRTWLHREGVLFLSARRLRTVYDAAVLSLQWIALRREKAEWGDSHTRWVAPDGKLQRSFVHVFTEAGLRREVGAAGFRMESWLGGHAVLVPRQPAIIR